MKPWTFMIVAGEASGDLLAAELVLALRTELAARDSKFTSDPQPLTASLRPRFFGAGGDRLREAGVEVVVDMAAHGVIGLTDALRKYGHFRRCFKRLLRLAFERQPDAVICVDFSGFNLRFASAVKRLARKRRGAFFNWDPRIVQYVSPQVWASRAGRVRRIQRDVDLVLSIFPFEKQWYAAHAPQLRVEFIGHPMVDRYADQSRAEQPEAHLGATTGTPDSSGSNTRICQPLPDESGVPLRLVALLPGSRIGELKRHLPVMCDAAHRIANPKTGVSFRMPLPAEELVALANTFSWPANTEIHSGKLTEALRQATVAIASTGTVTMECAFFGVPTVALYKTSPLTYHIGKRLVTVRHLAMPNLLAGEEVFPEFIQNAATGENIAQAALALLDDTNRRATIKKTLRHVVASLGPPGAARRGAQAILDLL